MKTTSQRRKNASRANGTLSKGPKTDEGKAKSSLNAIRHGMLADTILLRGESPDVFKELYFAFMDRYQPTDEVERGLIEEMVVCHWRLRRGWLTETEFWNHSLEQHPGRLRPAFTDLARTPEFALLNRYEARLHRMSLRSLKCLLDIRAHQPARADAGSRPEVEPAAEPEPEPAPKPEPAAAPTTPVENKPDTPSTAPKTLNFRTNLIPKSNTPKPSVPDLDPEILARLVPNL